MKRNIKKDKPVYRLYIQNGAFAIVNMDNVLLYMTRSIFDLACTCALFTNMPWQIDAGDLMFPAHKEYLDKFWSTYGLQCDIAKQQFVKLHHTNLV